MDAGREGALSKQVAVEPDHLVAGAEQHRDHPCADVALVAGEQNPHIPNTPPWVVPRGPLQNDLSAVESFSVLFGCLRFDTANSQKREKRIGSEPILILLGLEAVHDHSDLF